MAQHNGSSTIQPLPNCVNGYVNSVPSYIRATAAVSCVLSMIGVLVILCTHVAFKKYRNKARTIIVHISIMDFTVAMANFIGIVVDFDSLLYPYYAPGSTNTHDHRFEVINNFCIAQAAFAIYGTICSVLWTTALTVYFYFTIVGQDVKFTKRLTCFFYCVCYGLPLVIIAWLGSTGKMGYSPVGGGGWCSLIFEKKMHVNDRFTIFLGYDLWLYITITVVTTTTIAIMAHLKTQIPKESMSEQNRSAVQSIEKKLLTIPILFIGLRIWSFLLVLITLYTELKSCALVMFFLGMGAIGDSGQGFFNAVIFCLLTKRVRASYKDSLMKCFRSSRTHEGDKLTNGEDTVTAVGIESDAGMLNSGSLHLAKPYTKQWQTQSAALK